MYSIDSVLKRLQSWIFEIMQAREFNKQRIEKMKAIDFLRLIGSLGFSSRQCMDPVDYVYGILGMLQIKMPRLDNPADVWTRFLYELGNYMETMGPFELEDGNIIKINEHAYQIDICRARDMADIYFLVLTITRKNER